MCLCGFGNLVKLKNFQAISPVFNYLCQMLSTIRNQKDILEKLGIEKLNPMQEETQTAMQSDSDVVLLSPTGTGKTLAFLLPIIATLDEKITEVQVLILAPTRELSIQIEQVVRQMGAGYKVNAVYGGRARDRKSVV